MQIFDQLGIPSAATILNIVVISAAVSAINSDIFGAGRMLYGMAQQGQAPRGFAAVSRRGVPWMTVVVMSAALLIGVVLNYLIPKDVFLLIASIATFATVWVWLMILLSQFNMRRKMDPREAAQLKFPVPLWPAGPILAIAFMVFVILVLATSRTRRPRLSWEPCGSRCCASPIACGCCRSARRRRCASRSRARRKTRPGR